jgi:hypothetical protein
MLQESALRRAIAGSGTYVDFAGRWVNELGSEVVVSQTADHLSGTYESAVSTGGTKTTGDLTGFVDGDLISFTVHWRDYQAIRRGLASSYHQLHLTRSKRCGRW